MAAHSRRAFLGGLVLGPASITASQSIPVEPVTDGAVQFLAPMCPSCCCLFDITQMIPMGPNESYGARVERGLKPIAATCQYCEWQGNVTFYRRL